MKCSNCGFENPEKSKFCGKCGKALMKIRITNIMILLFILIIGILSYLLLAVPTEDNMDADKRTPGPTTTVMPTTTSPMLTTVIPTGTTSKQNFSTPELAEIIISPSTLSILTGQTRKFYSVSKDQFGKPVDSTITWTSSNPDVGAIDSSGFFKAISSGTTIITAESGTISKTATVTVSRPPILTKIIISPSSPSIETGKTQVFTASPKDQYDQPMQAAISWTSSDPRVGTINNNGVFTSISTGTTTITAAGGSVTGTAIITVIKSPPVLTKIIVNPSSVSVEVGKNQNFQASPYDQYDQPISTTISWASSDAGVGTINNNGVFTPIAPGTTTITATSGLVFGTAFVRISSPPDKISNFKVNSISNKEITISVDYTYNSDHGTNVFMGAYAVKDGQKLLWYGFSPSKVNQGTGSGTIGITFGYNNPPASVTTDQIQVDLYVGGGSAFYSEKFDYSKTWSQGLTAPAQLSPADGSVFSIYPRSTTVTWSQVSGAASYTVEVDCYHCCQADQWCTDVGQTWDVVPGLTQTSYTFNYVGAQPGRWRVWAIDANGQAGPKSGWWGFSYTQ